MLQGSNVCGYASVAPDPSTTCVCWISIIVDNCMTTYADNVWLVS